jgi:restriction system protein
VIVTQQKPFCTKCGNQFKKASSRFCPKCGNPIKDRATSKEVSLDSLTGHEFEALCKRVFEKIWGCKVESGGLTNDRGKDLIIHTKQGKIVVECKHHKGRIGRPIVQKFHSAVLDEKTNRGIIVSTGGFADNAMEYANGLNVKIELYDVTKLAEMAQTVGIKIIMPGKDLQTYTFPLLDAKDLENKFSGFLTLFESKPVPAKNLFKIIKQDTSCAAIYESIVNINEDFYTSVGCIHQIHKNNSTHLFDASGKILSIYRRYIPTHNSSIVFKKTTNPATQHFGFNLDDKAIRSKIKQQIIEENTEVVKYPAKKIQKEYSKTCKPKDSSVEITDIKKIMLPYYALKFNFLQTQYSCELLETKMKLNIIDTDLFNCKICHGIIDDTAKGHETVALPFLCNSCGIIAHNPSEKTNCSHLCEICGKTICKKCAWKTRKYLVMKKIMCEPCAKQNTKKTSKLN